MKWLKNMIKKIVIELLKDSTFEIDPINKEYKIKFKKEI